MMEQPNLSYINSMSSGDEVFEKHLLDIIKREFPLEKQVYFDNVKSNNFKQAAQNVHKLKHKISILGLEKSYDIAVAYEENLLNNDSTLQQEFESILLVMTDYLSNV